MMEEDKYIDPEVGQIVLCEGKRIGEVILIEEPDNYGIKFDNCKWSVNLQFFLQFCGDDDIRLIPKEEYMEKKCENCVFCKSNTTNFLPNDWICNNAKSKWYGYCPPTGECEKYKEPSGETVEETMAENAIQFLKKFADMANSMWGNDSGTK